MRNIMRVSMFAMGFAILISHASSQSPSPSPEPSSPPSASCRNRCPWGTRWNNNTNSCEKSCDKSDWNRYFAADEFAVNGSIFAGCYPCSISDHLLDTSSFPTTTSLINTCWMEPTLVPQSQMSPWYVQLRNARDSDSDEYCIPDQQMVVGNTVELVASSKTLPGGLSGQSNWGEGRFNSFAECCSNYIENASSCPLLMTRNANNKCQLISDDVFSVIFPYRDRDEAISNRSSWWSFIHHNEGVAKITPACNSYPPDEISVCHGGHQDTELVRNCTWYSDDAPLISTTTCETGSVWSATLKRCTPSYCLPEDNKAMILGSCYNCDQNCYAASDPDGLPLSSMEAKAYPYPCENTADHYTGSKNDEHTFKSIEDCCLTWARNPDRCPGTHTRKFLDAGGTGCVDSSGKLLEPNGTLVHYVNATSSCRDMKQAYTNSGCCPSSPNKATSGVWVQRPNHEWGEKALSTCGELRSVHNDQQCCPKRSSSSGTAPSPTPQASSECSDATDMGGCESITGCSWGVAHYHLAEPFCMESDSCDMYRHHDDCEDSDHKPCTWKDGSCMINSAPQASSSSSVTSQPAQVYKTTTTGRCTGLGNGCRDVANATECGHAAVALVWDDLPTNVITESDGGTAAGCNGIKSGVDPNHNYLWSVYYNTYGNASDCGTFSSTCACVCPGGSSSATPQASSSATPPSPTPQASSSATPPSPTPQASSSSSSQCSGATDRHGCVAITGCSWGIAPQQSQAAEKTGIEDLPFCLESDYCDRFNETSCDSSETDQPCMWYVDGVTSPHCTIHVPRNCRDLNATTCKAYNWYGCSYGTVNLKTNGVVSNETLPVCMDTELDCNKNAPDGAYRCCGEFTETDCDAPPNLCEWDSVTSRCIGSYFYN